MSQTMNRRGFVQLSLAASAFWLVQRGSPAWGAGAKGSRLVSPGCRGTKVKVARVFMGNPKSRAWPRPDLDLDKEVQFYRAEFQKLQNQLSDVEFVADELVVSANQVASLDKRLKKADGILAIQLNMGISRILEAILDAGRPTSVFAVPYSGHEWTRFGQLQQSEQGAKLACYLTSDYQQLAAAIRPFRALHHLREAKILDVTTRPFEEYAAAMKEKFGTEIQRIELQRMVDAYQAVDEAEVKAEAARWTNGAVAVVEPSAEDIVKACRMGLAFQRLLDEENATVMTVDCYGSMYHPLCQAYAYPCIGFTRLNDMGLAGICEADLQSAMTFILYQGLTGRPGFISDPTIDESKNGIILAHCLGTRKMDGPEGPAAPYKLRTVMERQEGVVAQVRMRVGQQVTQAKLVGTDMLPYFTGRIIDTPDVDRGCRTKITVQVDGDATRLWKSWRYGLHRVTCYGDITDDLRRFCRFAGVEMVDEAV